MNKQSEWQADENEPPTAEEMFAYSDGTLPAEEAARVWERLQQYPELARAYTEPFPAAGAEAGDPHHLSGDEIGRRWESFRTRIPEERGGRVIQFPRTLSSIAAVLILALGGLLWQSQMKIRRLQSELAQPHMLREVVLDEDAAFRGRGPARAVVSGKDLKLVLLTNADHHEHYDAELRDISTQPGKPRWRERVERTEEDEVEITLLRIEPGQYEIVLYGITGDKTQRLGAYSFNIAP
jgi:hypothetical protein